MNTCLRIYVYIHIYMHMWVSSEDRVYCRNVHALRTDNKSIWFLNLPAVLLSQWTGMIRVSFLMLWWYLFLLQEMFFGLHPFWTRVIRVWGIGKYFEMEVKLSLPVAVHFFIHREVTVKHSSPSIISGGRRECR